MTVPARAAGRLSAGLKRFAPILSTARAHNVNESATSRIVTHMLADIFGYDMYSEETREPAIREEGFQILIEVKAIGLQLEEPHVRQAVDYASNRGIEWVALTNGHLWQVFRVIFSKPVDAELVLDLDLLSLSPKNNRDLESLYLLTRESMLKSGLYAYHDRLQATNKLRPAAGRPSRTAPRLRRQGRPGEAP